MVQGLRGRKKKIAPGNLVFGYSFTLQKKKHKIVKSFKIFPQNDVKNTPCEFAVVIPRK